MRWLFLLLTSLGVAAGMAQSLVWRTPIDSTGIGADLGGILRTDKAGRVLGVGQRAVRGNNDIAGDLQYIWKNGTVNTSGVYRGSGGQAIELYDAAIDSKGGTFLLYRDHGLAAYGLGLTLARFSPATGKALWTVSLAEVGGGRLMGGKLVVDPANHLLVGTTDWSPVRPSRYRLARVSPEGRLLMNRRMDRSSSHYDTLHDLAADPDGSVYLVGTAGPDSRSDRSAVPQTQILSYRVRSTNAAIFWSRLYPSFAVFSNLKLAQDPFGDIVIGAQRIDGITYLNSFAALKLARNGGGTLWFRTYAAPQDGDMTFTDLAVRSDGSVVLAGDASHPDTYDPGGLVAVWDRNGTPLWARNLPGSELWGTTSVTETWFNDRLAIDSAGHVYFGSSEIGIEVQGRLTSGFVLTKLAASTGIPAWRRPYRPNPTGSHSTSSVAMAKNEPVLFGTMESGPLTTPAVQQFLQGVNPATGSAVWTRRSTVTAGPQSDRVHAIDLLPTGETAWAGSHGGLFAAGIVKAGGGRLWTWVFDDTNSEEPRSLQEGATQVKCDPEGHLVVFGQNRGVAVVARLNRTTGSPIWTTVLDAPPAGRLCVDRFGHVIVGLAGYPPRVVKLHGVNGREVWRQPFDGSGDNEDLASITVDGNAHVYATGRSWDDTLAAPYNPNMRFLTAKYEMKTGRRLWARVHSPPVTREVRPLAIEVDRLGFVVVAGSWSSSRGMDGVLLRYRAVDGVTNWVVFRDFSRQDEFTTALAVDRDGHIYTAGTTIDGTSLLTRPWISKTSPTGGRTVWQSLGPAYGVGTVPSAIAISGTGDIYLAGVSTPDRSNNQLYVAKLRGTTGAVSSGVLVPNAAAPNPAPDLAVSPTGRIHVGASMLGSRGDSVATVMQFR